jgi:hypothetical protein
MNDSVPVSQMKNYKQELQKRLKRKNKKRKNMILKQEPVKQNKLTIVSLFCVEN